MKLAYILLCHKNVPQVDRLLSLLAVNGNTVVLHISKTSEQHFYSDMKEVVKKHPNVFFCKREDGTHNGFGIVKGIMNAIAYLLDNNIDFDYVSLVSGQDYPIKSDAQIKAFLTANKGTQFLEYYHWMPGPSDPFYENHPWGPTRLPYRLDRHHFKIAGATRSIPELETVRLISHPLYQTVKIFLNEAGMYKREKRLWLEFQLLFWSRVLPRKRKIPTAFTIFVGKTWWTITKDCARFALEEHKTNSVLRKFFRFTLIPDEMYFQTILMNSKYRDNCVNNYLREIEWKGGDGTHPIIFTSEHFDRLKNSSNHFARKLDMDIDSAIFDRIDKELLK